MYEIEQTLTFEKWLNKLKDQRGKALVAARIFRLANGLMGDVSHVGDGVSELRIHFGPGYRVYFKFEDQTLILLLCGGNKTSQSRDILKAKALANEA